MEIRAKHIIDEFLLLVLVVSAARLVLKHDVVIPAALHCEVAWIEERVATSYVNFALFLFLGCSFGFLRIVMSASRFEEMRPYLLGSRLSSFFLDLLQFTHESRSLVLIIVPRSGLAIALRII